MTKKPPHSRLSPLEEVFEERTVILSRNPLPEVSQLMRDTTDLTSFDEQVVDLTDDDMVSVSDANIDDIVLTEEELIATGGFRLGQPRPLPDSFKNRNKVPGPPPKSAGSVSKGVPQNKAPQGKPPQGKAMGPPAKPADKPAVKTGTAAPVKAGPPPAKSTSPAKQPTATPTAAPKGPPSPAAKAAPTRPTVGERTAAPGAKASPPPSAEKNPAPKGPVKPLGKPPLGKPGALKAAAKLDAVQPKGGAPVPSKPAPQKKPEPNTGPTGHVAKKVEPPPAVKTPPPTPAPDPRDRSQALAQKARRPLSAAEAADAARLANIAITKAPPRTPPPRAQVDDDFTSVDVHAGGSASGDPIVSFEDNAWATETQRLLESWVPGLKDIELVRAHQVNQRDAQRRLWANHTQRFGAKQDFSRAIAAAAVADALDKIPKDRLVAVELRVANRFFLVWVDLQGRRLVAVLSDLKVS